MVTSHLKEKVIVGAIMTLAGCCGCWSTPFGCYMCESQLENVFSHQLHPYVL